jgi:hypothetical protein
MGRGRTARTAGEVARGERSDLFDHQSTFIVPWLRVRRAVVMRAPQGWNLISDGGGAIADEEIN